LRKRLRQVHTVLRRRHVGRPSRIKAARPVQHLLRPGLQHLRSASNTTTRRLPGPSHRPAEVTRRRLYCPPFALLPIRPQVGAYHPAFRAAHGFRAKLPDRRIVRSSIGVDHCAVVAKTGGCRQHVYCLSDEWRGDHDAVIPYRRTGEAPNFRRSHQTRL
jgi:hypothetical protein